METQQVEVQLQDIVTGIIYSTHLSPDDAKRVETNIVYASKVLESLKNSKRNITPSNSMASTSNPDAAATSAAECNIEQDSAFKWSHQAILLLIEEYRKREEDTISGKMSQKRTWEMISEVLCSHGHDVTGPQCQSKFNGMKKTFKSIKDHNSKSGNARRSWPYSEMMESLLGEKPFMKPVALASSSGEMKSESEYSDVSSDSSCSTSSNFNSPSSRKRKACNVGHT